MGNADHNADHNIGSAPLRWRTQGAMREQSTAPAFAAHRPPEKYETFMSIFRRTFRVNGSTDMHSITMYVKKGHDWTIYDGWQPRQLCMHAFLYLKAQSRPTSSEYRNSHFHRSAHSRIGGTHERSQRSHTYEARAHAFVHCQMTWRESQGITFCAAWEESHK